MNRGERTGERLILDTLEGASQICPPVGDIAKVGIRVCTLALNEPSWLVYDPFTMPFAECVIIASDGQIVSDMELQNRCNAAIGWIGLGNWMEAYQELEKLPTNLPRPSRGA